jgi:hypothetical protein
MNYEIGGFKVGEWLVAIVAGYGVAYLAASGYYALFRRDYRLV